MRDSENNALTSTNPEEDIADETMEYQHEESVTVHPRELNPQQSMNMPIIGSALVLQRNAASDSS